MREKWLAEIERLKEENAIAEADLSRTIGDREADIERLLATVLIVGCQWGIGRWV
jgi:hypothetical protein